MSDSLHSVAHPVQAPRSNTEARPYARPVAGVRASAPKFVRPLDARSHVPASPEELPAVRFPMLESSPRATQADLDLPWVTAYLDAESSSDAPDALLSVVDRSASEDVPPPDVVFGNGSASMLGPDNWLLQDTAAKLSEISAETFVRAPVRDEHAPTLALPAWSDDDLLVIMSATRISMERDETLALTRAATRSEGDAGTRSNAFSIAAALESLAVRVRAGELSVPDSAGCTDDASALAATLPALLTSRS